MLFKMLKLFGVDIPARMAEVRIDLEERFDVAKDGVEQAAQTAAVLAILFFLASVAALSAFGVGLIALYSWVSSNYGQFYGFGLAKALGVSQQRNSNSVKPGRNGSLRQRRLLKGRLCLFPRRLRAQPLPVI
jgi:hypothetical protein